MNRVVFLPFITLLIVNVCDVLLQQTSENSDAYDIYKNKEIILKNVVPDLSVLTTVNFVDSKADYFKKLLAAWENLSVDRTLISKGKREN